MASVLRPLHLDLQYHMLPLPCRFKRRISFREAHWHCCTSLRHWRQIVLSPSGMASSCFHCLPTTHLQRRSISWYAPPSLQPLHPLSLLLCLAAGGYAILSFSFHPRHASECGPYHRHAPAGYAGEPSAAVAATPHHLLLFSVRSEFLRGRADQTAARDALRPSVSVKQSKFECAHPPWWIPTSRLRLAAACRSRCQATLLRRSVSGLKPTRAPPRSCASTTAG